MSSAMNRAVRRLSGLPLAAAVVSAINAACMTIIALGNVTDFSTNRVFVAHVLAMDTTLEDPNLMWRSITSPAIQSAAYVAMIAWETAAAGLLIGSLVAWLRGARSSDYRSFRSWASVGLVMIVALFGGGFMAIGGEWFASWQSAQWNGLAPAMRNVTMAAFGLVLVHLPSSQWSPPS